MTGVAEAAPQQGTVTGGSSTITQSGNTTTIHQTTERSSIDWQSFSIGSNEQVTFVQPNSSAISLDRVMGPGVSTLAGSLTANGQVVLINSNGILFAPGASVNLAGLIATTSNISDSDFMAGKLGFNQASTNTSATVINQGTIDVAAGGYAVLSAAAVANTGTIKATLGKVVLAGATAFTVDFDGDGLLQYAVTQGVGTNPGTSTLVEQAGTIAADGGQVLMTARAAKGVIQHAINMDGMTEANAVSRTANGTLIVGAVTLDGGTTGAVEVTGSIQATNTAGVGGTVQVLGENVSLTGSGAIQASGSTGGGTVLIGGNEHGAGPQANAESAYVAEGTTITASATTKGNGGKVVVWSDTATWFAGKIDVEGGAAGGNGGFVETSSKQYLAASGSVDAKATHGKAGTWLLDPDDVIIETNGGNVTNGSFSGGVFTPGTGSPATIDPSVITSALNAGTSVNISTSSGSGGSGNITVSNAITMNASNSSTAATLNLTASTGGMITINAPINVTSGLLSVALTGSVAVNANVTANAGLTASGNSTSDTFTQAAGTVINSGNGFFTLSYNSIALTSVLSSGSYATILPQTYYEQIGVGTGTGVSASNGLVLSNTSLNALSGFSEIYIGSYQVSSLVFGGVVTIPTTNQLMFEAGSIEILPSAFITFSSAANSPYVSMRTEGEGSITINPGAQLNLGTTSLALSADGFYLPSSPVFANSSVTSRLTIDTASSDQSIGIGDTATGSVHIPSTGLLAFTNFPGYLVIGSSNTASVDIAGSVSLPAQSSIGPAYSGEGAVSTTITFEANAVVTTQAPLAGAPSPGLDLTTNAGGTITQNAGATISVGGGRVSLSADNLQLNGNTASISATNFFISPAGGSTIGIGSGTGDLLITQKTLNTFTAPNNQGASIEITGPGAIDIAGTIALPYTFYVEASGSGAGLTLESTAYLVSTQQSIGNTVPLLSLVAGPGGTLTQNNGATISAPYTYLSLNADVIQLNGASSSVNVTGVSLSPSSPEGTIGVGTASGTLQITQTLLNQLASVTGGTAGYEDFSNSSVINIGGSVSLPYTTYVNGFGSGVNVSPGAQITLPQSVDSQIRFYVPYGSLVIGSGAVFNLGNEESLSISTNSLVLPTTPIISSAYINASVNISPSPLTTGASVGIGDGATGSLLISSAELGAFAGYQGSLRFDGYGTINIAGTVNVPVTTSFAVGNGGTITVNPGTQINSATSTFQSDYPYFGLVTGSGGSITIASGATFNIGSGSLTLMADQLSLPTTPILPNSSVYGRVTIETATAGNSIGVGDGASGSLVISSAGLGAFAGYQGYLQFNEYAQGSAIDIAGTVNLPANTNFTVGSGGTIAVNPGAQINLAAPITTQAYYSTDLALSTGSGGAITIGAGASFTIGGQYPYLDIVTGLGGSISIAPGATFNIGSGGLILVADQLSLPTTPILPNSNFYSYVSIDTATPAASIAIGDGAVGTLKLSSGALGAFAGYQGELVLGDFSTGSVDIAGTVNLPFQTAIYSGYYNSSSNSYSFTAGNITFESSAVVTTAQPTTSGWQSAAYYAGLYLSAGSGGLITQDAGARITVGAGVLGLSSTNLSLNGSAGSITTPGIALDWGNIGIGTANAASGGLQITQPMLDSLADVVANNGSTTLYIQGTGLNIGTITLPFQTLFDVGAGSTITVSGTVTGTQGISFYTGNGSVFKELAGASIVGGTVGIYGDTNVPYYIGGDLGVTGPVNVAIDIAGSIVSTALEIEAGHPGTTPSTLANAGASTYGTGYKYIPAPGTTGSGTITLESTASIVTNAPFSSSGSSADTILYAFPGGAITIASGATINFSGGNLALIADNLSVMSAPGAISGSSRAIIAPASWDGILNGPFDSVLGPDLLAEEGVSPFSISIGTNLDFTNWNVSQQLINALSTNVGRFQVGTEGGSGQIMVAGTLSFPAETDFFGGNILFDTSARVTVTGTTTFDNTNGQPDGLLLNASWDGQLGNATGVGFNIANSGNIAIEPGAVITVAGFVQMESLNFCSTACNYHPGVLLDGTITASSILYADSGVGANVIVGPNAALTATGPLATGGIQLSPDVGGSITLIGGAAINTGAGLLTLTTDDIGLAVTGNLTIKNGDGTDEITTVIPLASTGALQIKGAGVLVDTAEAGQAGLDGTAPVGVSGATIGLGTAAGTLQLSSTTLSALSVGSQLTIGDAGTVITVGETTVTGTAPMSLVGSQIDFTGGTVSVLGGGLTLAGVSDVSGSTTIIAQSITSTGGFDSASNATGLTLQATTGSVSATGLSSTPAIEGFGAVSVTGTTITVGGLEAGTVTLNGAVTVTGAVINTLTLTGPSANIFGIVDGVGGSQAAAFVTAPSTAKDYINGCEVGGTCAETKTAVQVALGQVTALAGAATVQSNISSIFSPAGSLGLLDLTGTGLSGGTGTSGETGAQGGGSTSGGGSTGEGGSPATKTAQGTSLPSATVLFPGLIQLPPRPPIRPSGSLTTPSLGGFDPSSD
jgi:filamentous hemagglutinin family protein